MDIDICVHNALEDVRRCLESVLRASTPPYSLILVDDGSSDETKDYLEQFANAQGAVLLRNELALGYTMDQINSVILRQFEQQGLNINEGVAIDARLVKTASRPVNNEKLGQLRKEHDSPEGTLDKNGKPKKFFRDLDSNWVVKNNTPHYGLKEHASVDTSHGFILATTLSKASVNDTNYLPYCTAFSRHTKQPVKKVYADKGYAGEPNRNFLAQNNIFDGIMRKDSTPAKLTELEIERNKKLSGVRHIVEQYFGLSHLHDGAHRARFTTIFKNNFDCWYRQAAYNIKRGLKILKVATI